MFNNTRDEILNSLSTEDVKKVLIELGAANFIDNESKSLFITNTICHNESDGGMKLYCYENDDEEKDKYTFRCYTECSCSYSLYDIVMIVLERQTGKDIKFPEAINFVKRVVGIEDKKVFKGWKVDNSSRNADKDWEILKKLTETKKKLIIDVPCIENEYVLDVFANYHHELFLNDCISHEAMDKFEIGFYVNDEKISIPHRNPKDGSLMGIRGRTIRQSEVLAGYKYMPLTVNMKMYNFPSHGQLYGLWQNKETIKRLKKVVIFESEKSVLQCESYFEDNFTVALMGKSISQYQVDMLLELGVETVIFALDKEFEELNSAKDDIARKSVINLAKRFTNYCRTFVIYDEWDLLNYKESPSDRGKEVLIELMNKKFEIFTEE